MGTAPATSLVTPSYETRLSAGCCFDMRSRVSSETYEAALFFRRNVVRCHITSSNRPRGISCGIPNLFPDVQSSMLEVLRSGPASNRRGNGPPELKHRYSGERWAEPLGFDLELESPRRCGVERPLEQLLGYHGGVDELVTRPALPVGGIYGRGCRGSSDVMEFVMCSPLFNMATCRSGVWNMAMEVASRVPTQNRFAEVVRVGFSWLWWDWMSPGERMVGVRWREK